MGNAAEVNDTFNDLFHILKLKAQKNKVFHHASKQHLLHWAEIVNVMFILWIVSVCACARMLVQELILSHHVEKSFKADK